jgi:hypothetical protein
MTHVSQNTDWKLSTEIMAVDQPKSWRLVKKTKQESAIVAEEHVFTVRGILAAKDLPPIYTKPG